MDLNKLAVLVNQVGLKEAAKILKVTIRLIKKALEGENLVSYEIAKLQSGFSRLYLNDAIPERYDLDLDYLFGTGKTKGLLDDVDKGQTEFLDLTEKIINDARYFDVLRQAIAYDDITLEQIENGWTLFGNLTSSQIDKITDLLADNGIDRAEEMERMFTAYDNDTGRDLLGFWDIEDSEFWEWFRENFYS